MKFQDMKRVLIMDDQELNQFKDEIISGVISAIKSFDSLTGSNFTDTIWIDEKEAKQILGYHSKTKMQELRNSNSIVYSKFGRKIKYQRQSLIDFIERNKKTN